MSGGEQVALTGGGEATTASLAGGSDAASAPDSAVGAADAGGEIENTETGIQTSKIDSEHISFDFFVNIEIESVTDAQIIEVMAKSLATDEGQIEDVKLTQAGTAKRALTRISGKVHCDEWEMKILGDKFNRLIPDRILSQNIMDVLGLEDRPRVSRFFSRASTVGSSAGGLGIGAGASGSGSSRSSLKVSPYPKDEEKRSQSLRTEHNPEGGSGLESKQDDVRPKPAEGEDPAAPSSGTSCCLVM